MMYLSSNETILNCDVRDCIGLHGFGLIHTSNPHRGTALGTDDPGQSMLRVNRSSGKVNKESFDPLDFWNVPVGHKP